MYNFCFNCSETDLTTLKTPELSKLLFVISEENLLSFSYPRGLLACPHVNCEFRQYVCIQSRSLLLIKSS